MYSSLGSSNVCALARACNLVNAVVATERRGPVNFSLFEWALRSPYHRQFCCWVYYCNAELILRLYIPVISSPFKRKYKRPVLFSTPSYFTRGSVFAYLCMNSIGYAFSSRHSVIGAISSSRYSFQKTLHVRSKRVRKIPIRI